MKTVFRKEMIQYKVTPIGAVFLAAFWAFTGYYFTINILLSARSDISSFFQNVFSLLMILIPLLTMRIYSEEKRQGTDQLLLTSPISIWSIVFGKFLATFCIFLLGSLSVIPGLIILYSFNSLDTLMTIGNLFALILIGMAFISIGILASTLTENQIVAAVLTYVLLLGLWSLDYLKAFIGNTILLHIISYVSFRSHFSILGSGVFPLATFVYFLSLTVLMLLLSCMAISHRRVG